MLVKMAAGLLLAFLAAYAMLGGADFGGGLLAAWARGPRAERMRAALYRAIGPVWETNNVWLVGAVVVLFAAFPEGFGDLFTALLLPITFGLLGLVCRGGAFAMRNFASETDKYVPLHYLVFFMASAATPFFFGAALGAAGGGEIELTGNTVSSNLVDPWLRPFPVLVGLTAVAVCVYLASFYMTTRTGDDLRDDFRRIGLTAGVVLAALAVTTLVVARWDAPDFWDNWQRSTPLAMSAATLGVGLAALYALWNRWYLLAPMVAGGAIGLLVFTWGTVQYPYLIMPLQEVFDVAAADTMLRSYMIGLLVGAVLLLPALFLLYLMFVSERTDAPEGARPYTEPPA